MSTVSLLSRRMSSDLSRPRTSFSSLESRYTVFLSPFSWEAKIATFCYNPFFRIRIDLALLDPDPHWQNGSGSRRHDKGKNKHYYIDYDPDPNPNFTKIFF
jgi:hypothetical protein